MSPELLSLLGALAGIFGGGFGAWLAYRLNKRKTAADTASIIEAASGRLVERLEKKVDDLEKDICDLRLQLAAANNDIKSKNEVIEQLEKRVSTLEEIIIIKDGKIAALIKENLEKDAKIASLEKRVAELESELVRLRLKG